MSPQVAVSGPAATTSRPWLICLLLAVVVLAAYWNVGRCDFVSLDDPAYITQQPMVRHGVRPAALIWAVSASHGGNWHPLTTLSHLVDCSLFGLAAAPPHWENVLLHVANTTLVFFFFQELTSAIWISMLAAAFFGLHPLRVESVAWIAERKDVLCAFFWLLGLNAYLLWARAPSRGRYAFISLCCLLALLSKPMAVTLPLTLLLLDYWPLRRLPAVRLRRLIWEKLPWFGIAVLFCLITYFVQRSVSALAYGQRFDLSQRIGNALVSYVRYLGKTFWPTDLAVMYPHPGSWPLPQVIGAAMILMAVSGFAVWQRRRRPWILFGWLWFLVTLAPTIGIVQAGRQAMADRYTYVPSLGIIALVALGFLEILTRWPTLKPVLILSAGLAVGGCFILTRNQVEVWKNGVSLFEHNQAVSDDASARASLADAMQDAGRPVAEVLAQNRRALELDPACPDAIMRIAWLDAQAQRYEEARAIIKKAKRDLPAEEFMVHKALGVISVWQDRPAEAAIHLTEALRLRPFDTPSRRELAHSLLMQGRLEEARHQIEMAISMDWWDAIDHEGLGVILEKQGLLEESKRSYERALWIDPGSPDAPLGLARLRSRAHPNP